MTKKQKLSASMVSLILLGLLGSCSQTGDRSAETEVQQLTADRDILAASAEELPSVSDLIIVFTPSGQENVIQTFEDGTVAVGYTRTTGTAAQVLAGDLTSGETVTITEECYTTDSEDSGSVLWTQGGYLPMEIGESYLLFLCAYAEDSSYAGMYYPVDLEYGKYALSAAASVSTAAEASSGAEALEVNEYADLTLYSEWYEAVAALYPNILT